MCFGLKCSAHHCNCHIIMGWPTPVMSNHKYSDIWKFQWCRFPFELPPYPPSTITHIMYLKCLLHNLCSINFCFKGCDTTSAHYFPRLCSFWALCLNCFRINRLVCVCVCIRESAMILQSKVQLHHLITWKLDKAVMTNVGQYVFPWPESEEDQL